MYQVEKGQILGLKLDSPQNNKRLRCGIAVFVCSAFVVASALTFFIFNFTFIATEKPTRLDLDLQESWYLRRADWRAMPDTGMDLLELPVPFVLIGHSASGFCTERSDCITRVLAIQNDHQTRFGWYDIGPNYLVGGNGDIFEGRGANVIGAMVVLWNRIGISIMFIGHYVDHEPVQEQFDNVKILLEELVRKGVLMPNYIIYGHCQVAAGMISPGTNIVNSLDIFENWDPANTTGCE